jgi:hypothetical protein
MTPSRVRIASRVIAAADAAILAWGVLALFFPWPAHPRLGSPREHRRAVCSPGPIGIH